MPPTKASKYRGTLFLRGVPDRVKDLFKAKCAGRGATMHDVMVGLMRLYIDRPGVVTPHLKGGPPGEGEDE